MFSYVDKQVRDRLRHDERLVDLDRQGRPTADEDGSRLPHLALLGPIPLPRLFEDGAELMLEWYVFVRRVELQKVLDAGAGAGHSPRSAGGAGHSPRSAGGAGHSPRSAGRAGHSPRRAGRAGHSPRRAGRARGGDAEAFRALLQANMSVSSLLLLPGFAEVETPLVRVHSCCMTGDIFGSRRCECGPQLAASFERIRAEGGGAVVYMSGHEGRGIGLWAKAITYLLQDDGQDTYEANVSLGLPEDSRDFRDAGVALSYLLAGRQIRLLSNNPLKRQHLEQAGVAVREVVQLVVGVCEHNERYLTAKREKGHLV